MYGGAYKTHTRPSRVCVLSVMHAFLLYLSGSHPFLFGGPDARLYSLFNGQKHTRGVHKLIKM